MYSLRRDLVVFCFSKPIDAEAFAERFGGENCAVAQPGSLIRESAIEPFFFPSASSGEITAPTPFTYTVTGDQVTITLGTTHGVVLTGTPTGQTSVTVGTPPQVGFITKDDKIILTAPLTPVVQTITFSDGTIVPRICHNAAEWTKFD
jgi:hypothetical protein